MIEVISYCEPNKEPVSFISKTMGYISFEKRGEYGWSFDKIFIPQGEKKTLAEFEDDQRWKFWSNDTYWIHFDEVEKKLSYPNLKNTWNAVKDKILTLLK